jgi:LuxR family transcriptional regulator, activator of conjugal transfer of Ti plasmids
MSSTSIPPPSASNVSPSVVGDIEDALRGLDEVSNEKELEVSLSGLTRRLGFEYFSYILADRMHLGTRVFPKAMIATSYPESWRSRYEKRRYDQLDPVVTVGARSRQPFFWGSPEYLRQLPPPPRRLFDEARDFGIRSGFTVVVHGPGECGLLSVASSDGFEKFREAAIDCHVLLQVVSSRVHAIAVERLAAQTEKAPVSLTEHERVCLNWTMQGKTAWEISQILNRSRPTIDFHLQKAMRKLSASNKFHAAFKALQAGLI